MDMFQENYVYSPVIRNKDVPRHISVPLARSRLPPKFPVLLLPRFE